MILLEETQISDNALAYLKEINKLGGEISRGEMKHDYLTMPAQDSDFGRAYDECKEKGLIFKSDSGSMHSYIKHQITTRGYEVLKSHAKIYPGEKPVLCCFCKKPIHVSEFGGVSKELGFFHAQCYQNISNPATEDVLPELKVGDFIKRIGKGTTRLTQGKSYEVVGVEKICHAVYIKNDNGTRSIVDLHSTSKWDFNVQK